jgi:hypothetical protein
MIALFERFDIRLTKDQAHSASHGGQCDADVEILLAVPSVRRQFAKIAPDSIRAELREYGAWDNMELADDAVNQRRILWIAAGNIVEAR